MSKLSRRDFLKASAASFGAMVVATTIAGCGDQTDYPRLPVVETQQPQGQFLHGVASGDPMQDKVILWTRITPDDPNLTQAQVIWEVAQDPEFTTLVAQGTTEALAQTDFTVKIDLHGLAAGSVYYYRFGGLGANSMVGRTKTLPDVNVEQVSMAVVSCSNYPAGYFNVYSELAKQELDVILHLGDYIYEYGMGGFGTENSHAIGRALPEGNDEEIVSLVDYRKRYGLYRTDLGAQAAHAHAPFIVVWDDHEVTNNGWRDGAQYHDDLEHGDFESRKMAALQAYFEWMPIRPASIEDRQTIFRQFDFGQLVSLYMLDTRYYGRERAYQYGDFTDPQTGALDIQAFQMALADPNRTMLGSEQLHWLQTSMQHSSATWQVLGQQVLMGRMMLPVELLPYLSTPNQQVVGMLQQLAEIKQRIKLNDPSVTPQERARVETVAPFNLDAWDGYFVEREAVLATATALGKNLVVLTGDTHNSWANNLTNIHGEPVGVEFATTSVSSDGLGDHLNLNETLVQSFEEIVRLLVDDLKYFNGAERGFSVITFTPENATAQWYYVDNVNSTDYQLKTSRFHQLRMKAGDPQLRPV